MSIPTLPPFVQAHPLAVHFPVALLLAAPLLFFFGLFFTRHKRGIYIAAFFVMVLGTAGSFAAVATGHVAADSVRNIAPAAAEIMEEHEELAERTRNNYAVSTFLIAICLFGLPLKYRDISQANWNMFGVLAIVLCLMNSLALVNAAHLGGRLVHEYGITANWDTGASSQPVSNERE